LIKETIVSSCLGSKTRLWNLEKPIKKHHLQTVKQHGYLVPAHFELSGVAYLQKNYLIATGVINSKTLKISCNGQKCEESFKELKELLEKIL
jgi:hypothetical protein